MFEKNARDSRFFRWDDLAPWAPWATVPDPWRRVEVHATYREVSLESLRADEGANACALSLEGAGSGGRAAARQRSAGRRRFSEETSFPDFSGPETLFWTRYTTRRVLGRRRVLGQAADGQSHGDPPRGLAEL